MEKLKKDREELLAFYDFPAEHWVHIRTTNPIESTFWTVRLRTKRARKCWFWGDHASDGLQAAWDGTEEVETAQGICAADVVVSNVKFEDGAQMLDESDGNAA